MRIGMLTGGGDCPGLNAVIRAVVRKGVFHYHDEFVGFLEGWRGLIEDKSMTLDLDTVGGILPRGVPFCALRAPTRRNARMELTGARPRLKSIRLTRWSPLAATTRYRWRRSFTSMV